MTKLFTNTGPCFHLSLPCQRGQRDLLSYTEFINVHILHALSLPGHLLRVTRKPPTANWWVLHLALPEETSITINIVPCVKCALETAARFCFCLFCCFTSQVNSYGHGGTVSSPSHTFSWASLNKQLTSSSCTYFHL